ncbi:MAG TPA: S41 family peptidase [Allosphingosinicella sp.]|jgi:hypothetical protein
MRLPVLAFLVATALALPSAVPAAQRAPTAASAQAQRNLADFDFVVQKISDNYAGWHTKVTDATRPRLDALTARLRARAAAASDEELLALMGEWLGFFNDRHIGVRRQAVAAGAGGEPPTPSLPWTEADVRARLQALGTRREPVEGIWRIAGDRYRVGVLRTGDGTGRFAAVILTTAADNWRPGQVKAELARRADGGFDMVFRAGDHSENPVEGRLVADGDVLMVPDWGPWAREWPAPVDPEAAARLFPSAELFLRRLSPRTLWLRIPDFNDNRAAPLRRLIEAHRGELASTPNLIIDLRDNGGGSDYVYAPLVPLLYTRPIVTIGMELRASPDNIAMREQVAERIRAEAADNAAAIDAQNRLMRERLGQYVNPDPRPFEIERHATVLPFPRRVAVLIDGAASTGEQFLLLARQSRKTTLFGQRNSAGVLDFANVVGMPAPSGRYALQWATSRSLRLPEDPVDPDGIPPDIRIPDEIRDPVRYAAAWLERQVD